MLTTATGYLAASAGSGWIVTRLGIGLLLATSSLATAIGLLGYALAPSWMAMVALGLVAGLGAGAIDAGLNAYAALHLTRRLLNWLHACYGLGAAAGPLVMMSVLSAGHSWRWGYAFVGLVQIALGTCFVLTARTWPPFGPIVPVTSAMRTARSAPTWGLPIVWLSVLLFFVYTGLEVCAGQWPYTVFTEARSFAARDAGLWVSIYWANLAIGRLLFGCIANRVDPVVLLRTCMLGMLAGSALIAGNLGELASFLGLGLVGLAAAPVFPALIAITPRRLGPQRTANVVGFQVGAASLGALVPGLAGVLAERLGLEAIPVFMVLGALAMFAVHEAVVGLARRARA